jgi:phage-related protein (TIGR01555 family)
MSDIERFDVSPVENAILGIGTRRDPNEYTKVRNISGYYSNEALDAYYISSWACRRVVEIMPRLMCRKWGQLTFDGESSESILERVKKYSSDLVQYSDDLELLESKIKLIQWLSNRHKDLSLRKKVKQAQTWANLYGSAYILIVADDEDEDYSQPLKIDNVSKIEQLIVLDRYQIYPDGVSNYERINPEYYCLYTNTLSTSNLILPDSYKANNKVHKSRILEFIGNELPLRERGRNNGHGASVLEPFIDVWQRFFNGYASLSRVLTNFSIFVHYIDGLFDKLWQGGKEAERKLSDRLSTNQVSMSLYRGYVADLTKEKLDFISMNLGGVSETAECLKDELVAASGVPASVLFGQFAAGLDASGKITGEQRYLNDLVEEAQQDKFTDNIEYLNKLLLSEDDASEDDSVHGWQWIALYTESPKEKAEIVKIYAEADKINVEASVLVSGSSKAPSPKQEENEQEEQKIEDNEHLRSDAVRLASLKREGGRVRYKGKLYAPNKPYRVGDHYQVLATKNGFVQLVNFGENDVDTGAMSDDKAFANASDPYQPKYWANLYFSFGTPSTAKVDDSTPAKKIIEWQGFKIGLQYLPFEMRHGKMLTSAYGHFQKTKGADGMAVDVYCGTNLRSPSIFAIEQYINGEFDEEKYVIGVDSIEEARAIYLEVMPEEMLGSIRESSIDELRSLRTDADAITIGGDILSEKEFEAITNVDDNDVQEAIANWKQVAPSSYANILSAE